MKKIIAGIFLIVCLLAAGTGIFFWQEKKSTKEREEAYTQIRQSMNLDLVKEEREPLQTIPVDFEQLQKKNPDIYAWITIPGTEIDDPVLQSSREDGEYLEKDAFGQENQSGAIYSEQQNKKDFSDMLTVLYGRSTVAGGRFAELLNYEDEEYLQQHNLITVYTPEKAIHYQIFAAYRYDDRHLLQSFDCSDQTVYNAFIREILEQRNLYASINKEVNPQWPQKILTLSTGHPSGENYRYLVQAVEIKEQNH